MTLSICLKLSQTLRSLLPLLLLLIVSSSSSTTTLPLPLSLIVMMTFCKKSVHSFWGITNSMDSPTTIDKLLPCKCQADVSTTTPLVVGGGGGGLGLITATSVGDIQRSHNVVESSTIIKSTCSSPPSSPPPPPPSPFSIGRNMGFFDNVGGGVIDGLMSCTESLGFESCDERRVDGVDDEIDHHRLSPAGGGGGSDVSSSTRMEKWRKTEEEGMIMMRRRSRRREVQKFPPPISSLDSNGQPSFFLRPVRKDGRLELTEVRIDRPEILRAHREDGRLILHLIRNDRFFNTNEEQEHDEHEHEEIHEEQEPEEEEEEDEEEEEEIKEDESREWRLRMTGEGFRRCHELLVSHHHDYHPHNHHHQSNHHINLHMWSQHCVTTR